MAFFDLSQLERVHTKASSKIRRLGRSVSRRRMPRETEKPPLTIIDETPTDGTSTSKKDQDGDGTVKAENFKEFCTCTHRTQMTNWRTFLSRWSHARMAQVSVKWCLHMCHTSPSRHLPSHVSPIVGVLERSLRDHSRLRPHLSSSNTLTVEYCCWKCWCWVVRSQWNEVVQNVDDCAWSLRPLCKLVVREHWQRSPTNLKLANFPFTVLHPRRSRLPHCCCGNLQFASCTSTKLAPPFDHQTCTRHHPTWP